MKCDVRAFGEAGAFTLSEHMLLREYNLTLISNKLPSLIPKLPIHNELNTPSKSTLHAHQSGQGARHPLPYPSLELRKLSLFASLATKSYPKLHCQYCYHVSHVHCIFAPITLLCSEP